MGAKRLPCTANNLAPLRAAWLAALVDGEGSISLHPVRRDGSLRAWLAVYNTNVELLNRCRTITGVGAVRRKQQVHKDKHPRLPLYEWVAERSRDAHHLICQMYPYLIVKQDKAVRLIVGWRDSSFANPPAPDDSSEVSTMKHAQGGLSNREFARLLGVSSSFICQIYKGKRIPSNRLMLQIGETF